MSALNDRLKDMIQRRNAMKNLEDALAQHGRAAGRSTAPAWQQVADWQHADDWRDDRDDDDDD